MVLAFGLSGLAACGDGATDDDITTVQATLTTSPADPVAFCRSSGLNVIIGTSNNDVLNGTAVADCIVGLGRTGPHRRHGRQRHHLRR